MIDFELRFKVRYLKIELKVLVGCFLCGLIVWLSYTGSGNVKIIIMETLLCSYCALGKVQLKIAQRYMAFFNRATFSEGVKFVFGSSKKCLCVACNDLNNALMKGLGLNPLITHLGYTKDVYIYTSLMPDNKFVMTLFYIVYDAQAQRGKGSLSLLKLLLFKLL